MSGRCPRQNFALGNALGDPHTRNNHPGTASRRQLRTFVAAQLKVDTYHHIGNRIEYLAKLGPSLRHAGRLAIIDAKADSRNIVFRLNGFTQELNAAGYSVMETLRFLLRQYFLIFQKTGS